MNQVVRYTIKLFYLIILVILIQSCSTGKYLSSGQSLLDQNKLKFTGDHKPENKTILSYDLKTFYQQEPNSNYFFVVPREYYYFAHSSPSDTSWYDNWLRTDIGEPPAIFEEQLSASTATAMKKFLRNKKGYYNADTEYKYVTKNKKTSVEYIINTGQQYTIGEIKYIGRDSHVVQLVRNIAKNSFVKPGGPVDAAEFDKEKSRITKALQNKGYSKFLTNYVRIKGDSTNLDHKIDIFIEIQSPLPEIKHQRYKIGKVDIYTDYYQGQSLDHLSVDTLNGMGFFKKNKDFIIKPKSLLSSIYLQKGDINQQKNQLKTFKKLSNLGIYRFITVNPYYSEVGDSIINYNIFMTPYEHKWVSDFGLNLFYSTISDNGRQRLGVGGNASLLNRNIWKSGNTLSFDMELTDEFQITDPIQQSAVTLNLQSTLKMPKQYDLFGFASTMKFLRILRGDRYNQFKDEAKTTITARYNLQNINNAYNIKSSSITFGYDYTSSINSKFIIRQVGLDLNSYDLDSQFIDAIKDNQFIVRSFTDNLFTGFLFRDIGYYYQSPVKKNGQSFSLIANFEVSGGEVFLLNKLFNTINSSDDNWKLSNRYEYAQFAKSEVDFRYFKKVSKTSEFASRLNFGVALPIVATQEIPYPKQFFIGGPNSVRAWQIRELGPGGYEDTTPTTASSIFYQQGDIKFEFNLEYRFDLFWIVELAAFVDGGNVWTRKLDVDRPGSNFTSKFYDDLAIGAGWGIRWDFVYFKIRFDFGYQLRSPFEYNDQGDHWFKPNANTALGNVNVAVNYPF